MHLLLYIFFLPISFFLLRFFFSFVILQYLYCKIKILFTVFKFCSRFSVVIQDQVEEGLDNVVIIPISVIVLDENDNPPRYSINPLSQCGHHPHLFHRPRRKWQAPLGTHIPIHPSSPSPSLSWTKTTIHTGIQYIQYHIVVIIPISVIVLDEHD